MNSLISSTFNINTWVGNFTSNLFADAIVTVLLGFILFKWIEGKERWKERKENQRIIANLIAAELEHNRKQLKALITESPKGNLVFPALEIDVWEIIDKTEFLSFYKPENIADILNIYRRTASINQMYNSLLENSNWVATGRITTVRKEFMDSFTTRCQELLNYLDSFFNEIEKRKKNKK